MIHWCNDYICNYRVCVCLVCGALKVYYVKCVYAHKMWTVKAKSAVTPRIITLQDNHISLSLVTHVTINARLVPEYSILDRYPIKIFCKDPWLLPRAVIVRLADRQVRLCQKHSSEALPLQEDIFVPEQPGKGLYQWASHGGGGGYCSYFVCTVCLYMRYH